MALMETPGVALGFKAPDFRLKGIDGKYYTLADVKGERGTVVMFICNHCPYVKAVVDRLVFDMAELKKQGIGGIAVMSNDTENYPDDNFENMKKFAAEHRFGFPYVIDETQEVARAYGAVCTPDFFGFNAALELQYRGRLDEAGGRLMSNPRRELVAAMLEVARTGKSSAAQHPSMGCSIKWRSEAA